MEQTFEKYQLINELTGRIVYQLAIDSNCNDHEDRKYKKLNQIALQYSIPVNSLFWEQVR
jgi:hypothetical protein